MLLRIRQQLLQQESYISISQPVVFKAPVKAVEGSGRVHSYHPPRLYEDADGHGHLTAVDEVVEDSRRLPLDAVLIHIHTGWLVGPGLRRGIDPIIPPPR